MLVQMEGISKSFGGALVLRDVSFDVAAGEVHVLAGENGAGKSTLMRILSGAETAFEGRVLLAGRPVSFRGPLDAISAGIATIHQELSLVGSMSVADNLRLGREQVGRLGVVARAAQERDAARVLAELGLDVDPAALVEELPIATQQLVEIARALARDARVLVMDEPTSALDDHDARLLFERVSRLRARGRAIVYITHRMEEIYALADRVTVLRDGVRVGTAAPGELPREALVAWMAGGIVYSASAPRTSRESLATRAADAERAVGEAVLEVRGLSVPGPPGVETAGVREVTFTLRRGEILGVAGLRGSGTSELLHGVFGSRPARGEVVLAGQPFAERSPGRSIARGLVLLPSDRKASGLFLDGSVVDNAALASAARFSRFGFVLDAEEHVAVREAGDGFRLRAPSLEAPVGTLSGGNQQKVLVARCALARPSVLLLDEPTRGVDVAAKADIHRAVRGWAAAGAGVLVATSDTEELLELCDAILVLVRGRVVSRLPGGGTREAILAAAMGAAAAPRTPS